MKTPLSDQQLKAVQSEESNIRVIAGAGTGKTTTLTERIKYLVEEKNVKPNDIMAVTFTNKASKEISERLEGLPVRLGTFHSLSLKILRRHHEKVGLVRNFMDDNEDFKTNFTIADEEISRFIFEIAIANLEIFPPFVKPKGLTKEEEKQAAKDYKNEKKVFFEKCCYQVSRWKDSGLTIEQAKTSEEDFAKIYIEYQKELKQRNICDFADLILHVVNILEAHPDILQKEAGRIQYMLVDEFQDTNYLQYKWVKLLTSVHNNLFVVGDTDQSIYAFRNACPDIMTDLKGFQNIELSLNRRCTEEILAPAIELINYNEREEPKVLTSGKHGTQIKCKTFQNEFAESAYIAKIIKSLVEKGENPKEIACLYRSAWPMKIMERSFLKNNIKYKIVGNMSLMERMEIKDLIAYITLVIDPYNEFSFQRIVNKPTRSLGPAAFNIINKIARQMEIPYHEACVKFVNANKLKEEAKDKCFKLGVLLSSIPAWETPYEILYMIMNETNYDLWLKEKYKDTYKDRIDNIKTLMSLVKGYKNVYDFQQEILLNNPPDDAPLVQLSTIHASKGLEFKHVFCPAFERDIIPSSKALLDNWTGDYTDPWQGAPSGGMEEERRLGHVAFTRAKEKLFISFANQRSGRQTGASSFLEETGLEIEEPYSRKPIR